MRKTIIISLALLVAFIGTAVAKDKVYGEGVSEGEFTEVSQLLDKADTFQGKSVRVKGTAVSVCSHRGCWMDIGSDREGETIRIKVPDGVIVFPKSIIGKTVSAEGVFTKNVVTDDNHFCERSHEDVDEDDPFAEQKTVCTTTYQISAVGAVAVE